MLQIPQSPAPLAESDRRLSVVWKQTNAAGQVLRVHSIKPHVSDPAHFVLTADLRPVHSADTFPQVERLAKAEWA